MRRSMPGNTPLARSSAVRQGRKRSARSALPRSSRLHPHRPYFIKITQTRFLSGARPRTGPEKFEISLRDLQSPREAPPRPIRRLGRGFHAFVTASEPPVFGRSQLRSRAKRREHLARTRADGGSGRAQTCAPSPGAADRAARSVAPRGSSVAARTAQLHRKKRHLSYKMAPRWNARPGAAFQRGYRPMRGVIAALSANQNDSARQRGADARWRSEWPGGQESCYSAVTDADADVFAVAESPAEALERGHSMRCLMMRRLRAWRVMPRS